MKTQIHLFNMFALNYPYDFIEKVWDGSHFTSHLRAKFEMAYSIAGSYGAMIKFWAELDENNREILENWIINNYKG